MSFALKEGMKTNECSSEIIIENENGYLRYKK